ncbi:MAG: hypothetical protein Q9168_006763 [Polycauliona sp. 1 TL-2023]
MLAIADSAFHLLILELLLQAIRIDPAARHNPAVPFFDIFAFLLVPLPGDAGPENNVLAYAGGVEAGADRVALFEAELGPFAAGGNAGADGFADDGFADPLRKFDFFAGVIEGVGDFGLGAVFVGRDGGRGEGGGVVEFFVVGPIRAAVDNFVSKCTSDGTEGSDEGAKTDTHLAILDISGNLWKGSFAGSWNIVRLEI